MRPKFWKVSHGADIFNYEAVLDALGEHLVYVHGKTPALATSSRTQGEEFMDASVGDYFYLTHGNQGIYVLGQFSGAPNIFSKMQEGWLDRPYRAIKSAVSRESYGGPQKWWSPNHRSTFASVPDNELELFEEHILQPFFGIALADFEIDKA